MHRSRWTDRPSHDCVLGRKLRERHCGDQAMREGRTAQRTTCEIEEDVCLGREASWRQGGDNEEDKMVSPGLRGRSESGGCKCISEMTRPSNVTCLGSDQVRNNIKTCKTCTRPLIDDTGTIFYGFYCCYYYDNIVLISKENHIMSCHAIPPFTP